MKMRSRKTLKEYGLTEEMFIALYESQNGQCAICGVSEDELAEKYSGPSDWGSDRVLHIDHQRGARRGAYEGCFAATATLTSRLSSAANQSRILDGEDCRCRGEIRAS